MVALATLTTVPAPGSMTGDREMIVKADNCRHGA
jgi:hypothetical protein